MNKIKNIGLASWKHWREISFVFFIQLVFGFIVGLTFCSVICSTLDGSMVLDQLAKGFDRTVIMDVLNSNPGVLDTTKTIALSLLGIYLLTSIFLHAGWLANIKTKNYTLKSLLNNGLKYFLPFLGIALISLLLVIIFGVGVGLGFSKIVGEPLVTFSSEKPYVIWILFLIVLFILWSILVWSWSVTSRFYYIAGSSFFASLKLSFKTIQKNILKFIGVGLFLLSIQIFLMFIYNCIMADRGAPSWFIVIFGVLVQQILAFSRVTLRGFGYSFLEEISNKK